MPLFLSVVLELSALETGVRVLPLSVGLLATAAGIPKLAPNASPRRVVRLGVAFMLAGILVFVAGLDPGADAGIVTVPMLLIGLGLGALASQLGAVTVSAVPDKDSAEVGGLQNTMTNLGASLGTALIGSVLIATLSTSFLQGIQESPQVPPEVKSQATTELTGDVPFISDTQLEAALADTDLPPDVQQEIVAVNADSRLDGLRVGMSLAAILAAVALFFTGKIPTVPPGRTATAAEPAAASP